jgi:hypothetical protein
VTSTKRELDRRLFFRKSHSTITSSAASSSSIRSTPSVWNASTAEAHVPTAGTRNLAASLESSAASASNPIAYAELVEA